MADTAVSDEAAVSTEPSEAVDSTTEDSTESTTSESEPTESEAQESVEPTDFDLESLPPEARAYLEKREKELTGVMTRKTQEAAQALEKAQLYDQLQQEQLLQQKFPEPEASAKEQTVELIAQAYGVDPKRLSPDELGQIESLAKVMDLVIEKRVTESIQPMQRDLMDKEVRQELAAVKEKYPDFDNYTTQMKEIAYGNPNLSFEQLYKLATYNQAKVAGRDEALANKEIKKAQAPPKTTAGSTVEEEGRSIADFFKLSKKKLGK